MYIVCFTILFFLYFPAPESPPSIPGDSGRLLLLQQKPLGMETALGHQGPTDPDSGPGHSDHRKRLLEEGCRVVLKERGGAWWPDPATGCSPGCMWDGNVCGLRVRAALGDAVPTRSLKSRNTSPILHTGERAEAQSTKPHSASKAGFEPTPSLG